MSFFDKFPQIFASNRQIFPSPRFEIIFNSPYLNYEKIWTIWKIMNFHKN